MYILKRIWKYTQKYKWFFVFALIFSTLNVVIALVPGKITQVLIDDVIRGDNISLLPMLLLGFFLAASIRSLSIMGERYFIEYFSQGVVNDLKQSLYDHLQRQTFNFYNQNKTGELMSRMTGDMEAIRQLTCDGILNFTKMFFYLFFTFIVLSKISLKLFIFTMLASPFVAFFALRFSKKIKPAARRVREQFSRLNSTVQENIIGVRIVKSFHREEFEMEKFNRENEEFFRRNFASASIWAKYFPLLEFFSGLSTFFLLLFGGMMVINGEIQLGEWVQFNSYLWMLLMPMLMLGGMVDLINRTIVSGERIFSILDREPEIKNPENPVVLKEIKGEVEFRNVSLRFGSEVVLEDISLHAKPGDTIAIMGATGSGKTSLINLIARYYDPTEGQVLIDNINVRELDLKVLRENVAPVMQDVFLFSETIRENIVYGVDSASMDEIREAARIAGAQEFIEKMEEGYETVVGEMGVGLSGGQKQRVSIARALIKKAPILILDDATSAVDMETEQLIQESLEKIQKKCTTFIIAHRISSVRHADEIIILNNGRILERGTHEELLARKGQYYKIFKAQYRDLLEDNIIKEKQVMS
ncbi:MAG: ABC transporter ATP-binding protein [Halanaerobiaceae bacterium]|nr:ABC transporter ATP-binding protein [Halanaerobiaceae bacterium]